MATLDSEPKVNLSESYTAARTEFVKWAVNWFFQDPKLCETSESEYRTPDLAFLVSLLQTIGFDLHGNEMLPGGSHGSVGQGSGQEPRAPYSVNITCAQSGLNVVLRSKSSTEAPSISNNDAIKQENLDDIRMIASSVIPIVAPGVARLTREIVSKLVQLLSGSEQPKKKVEADNKTLTCTPMRQQTGPSLCQRHRSLDTFFPVDSSKTMMLRSKTMPSDDTQMDTEDMIAIITGSNEALYSYPVSPLLGGNSDSKPQLVRQKTWSIGSINELDDGKEVMYAPHRTSSPISENQQVVHTLGQLNLHGMERGVTARLEEACDKIHEVLLILNTRKDKKVPEGHTPVPSKINTKSSTGTAEARTPISKTPMPVLRSSATRFAQRTGGLKRQRSPPTKTPLAVRKEAATPKPVRRNISSPFKTPSSPRKAKGNEMRVGSFINMSDSAVGSPKLSQCAPSSAPASQSLGISSPGEGSLRPSGIRKPSLPTSRSVANLATASITPRSTTPSLRSLINRKCSSSVSSMLSSSNAPITHVPKRIPNEPKEGSKSVLRPSLLRAPSLISRFKK